MPTKTKKASRKSVRAIKNRARKAPREELLVEAQTLGMGTLGWIHGGGLNCGHCCIWGTATKACERKVGKCNPTYWKTHTS
jgi:hypothetical protein